MLDKLFNWLGYERKRRTHCAYCGEPLMWIIQDRHFGTSYSITYQVCPKQTEDVRERSKRRSTENSGANRLQG